MPSALPRLAPLLLSFLPIQLGAEDAALPLTQAARPVLVRAARLPSPWRKAPQSVTVISRQTLEAQEAKPLGEAIEGAAGAAYLVKGNGFSAAKSGVQMRGFAMGGEIVVARDGRKLNTDSDGEGFDLSLIDPGSLEAVELLRGASSSLYGSGAHAGVVNLVSRRPGAEPAKFRLIGGGSGFEHACVETEAASGPWGLRLAAAQTGSGDYWTPDRGSYSNSAFHRATASLLLERDLGAAGQLRLNGLWGRGWDNGQPGDLNAPSPDDRDRIDDRGYASAQWSAPLGAAGALKLLYDYGHKARETERLGPRSAARTAVRQQQLSRTHGGQLAAEAAWGGQRLAAGVEGARESHQGSGWIQPPAGQGYGAPKLPPSRLESLAAFCQDEWDALEGLRLSIGARGDYFHHTLEASPDAFYAASDAERSAPTGHLGASYEFLPGYSLKASGGNSYVAPNVVQLYTFDPRTGFALLGNPVLDAERGYSVDLGLAAEGRAFKAELTGYHSEMQGRLELGVLLRDFAAGGARFKDLNNAYSRPELLADPKLVNAPTNKWFYHRNLGLVQVEGLEGTLEWGVYKDWALAASFNAITKMVELSSGRWLDSIAPFSGRVAIEKRLAPLELSLSGRYGAGYETVSRTRPGLPTVFKEPYFVVDLRVRAGLGGGLTVILGGKNLLNTAWQQTLDVPEAGLEGRLGMELSL